MHKLISIALLSTLAFNAWSATATPQEYPWVKPSTTKNSWEGPWIGYPVGKGDWALITNDSDRTLTVRSASGGKWDIAGHSAIIITVKEKYPYFSFRYDAEQTAAALNVTGWPSCQIGGGPYAYGIAVTNTWLPYPHNDSFDSNASIACGIIPPCDAKKPIPGALASFTGASTGANYVPAGTAAHYCQN